MKTERFTENSGRFDEIAAGRLALPVTLPRALLRNEERRRWKRTFLRAARGATKSIRNREPPAWTRICASHEQHGRDRVVETIPCTDSVLAKSHRPCHNDGMHDFRRHHHDG